VNRWLRAFCWCVMQLDRIPSYRRTYTLDLKTRTFGPVQWKYQRNGLWGMYLLIDMKLFFRYIDMPGMEEE
jgi:hypothetical protein